MKYFPVIHVLIETYWNVKGIECTGITLVVSINRNILECKGQTQSNDNEDGECINRNILECKARYYCRYVSHIWY